METEQTPTSYNVPGLDLVSEPEEAAASLRKLYGEATGNKQHPLMNKAHPQHKDFLAVATTLHKIKNTGKLDPHTQGMKDGLDQIAADKHSQAVKAQGLANSLATKGTAPKTVTLDTPKWQADIWKMKLSRKGGNHQLLKNEINSHVIQAKGLGLKIPNEIQQKISTYSTSQDVTLEKTLSQEILVWLEGAHGEQDRKIAESLKPSGRPPYVCQSY